MSAKPKEDTPDDVVEVEAKPINDRYKNIEED